MDGHNLQRRVDRRASGGRTVGGWMEVETETRESGCEKREDEVGGEG